VIAFYALIFEIENIIHEKKMSHNTSSVVFLLILHAQHRDKSINTQMMVCTFSNEKVLAPFIRIELELNSELSVNEWRYNFYFSSIFIQNSNGYRCFVANPFPPDGVTLNRRRNKRRTPLLQLRFGLTAIIRERRFSTGAN
jgi:hypothetical protein